MYDLYSFSQIIKKSPFYNLLRDDIHLCYQRLASNQQLECEKIWTELEFLVPDLKNQREEFVQKYKIMEQETDLFRKKGFQFVCYGEEGFPAACYLMQEPPLSLSYWGQPVWQQLGSLSVVGSREPSDLSLQWMEKEFASFCEERDACIVSGGARGVDQKAHAMAIRKKRPTIVVLPSGLDCLYPSSLHLWSVSVLESGGCFVSEYSPQQMMHKYLFHHRNRLIAALGQATLLVEARRRSGTLITAQQALQLGKSVGVVAGHPIDPHFGGSLDLLSEGAFLVRDAQDLAMFYDSESEVIKGHQALVVGDLKANH